ncbi:MAG TPA: GMC oxidoreductase [Polyangia bacterium]|nr:GMC oxidoreductase [Polyangia bacterium]
MGVVVGDSPDAVVEGGGDGQLGSTDEFDAIVIGTGFGGAVTACRLAQAGLRICVLERGRRYALSDLPALPKAGETLPDPRRWTWQGSQGLWDLRNLQGVAVAQAAGYGGGSLVYANVHLRPPPEVFGDGWPAACRGRAWLDPHYDLAAYMLDVRPLPEAWRTSGKAGAMADAFRGAARGQSQNVFFPPLAIRFPERPEAPWSEPPAPPLDESSLPTNQYGRPQGDCRRCGACDVGCRYGAKNTLDRNYLAKAEKTERVEVRTLAEALTISRAAGGGYRIVYLDHLLESRASVSAKYLFVCGGAVNTTELLLRSQDQARDSPDRDPSLGAGLPGSIAGLGHDYFVNADALAMVLDTKVVVEPSAGPVITSALIHAEPTSEGSAPLRRTASGQALPRRPWFLIEDGGYPPAIAWWYAAVASPIFLGRNQFDPTTDGAKGLTDPTGLPPFARPDRYPALLDGVYAALRRQELPDVLPGELKRAGRALQKKIDRLRDGEVSALADAVRDAILTASPPFRLLAWLGLDRVGWLQRALRRWAVWLMGADQAGLLASTLAVARQRYGVDDPASLPARIARTLIGDRYPVETGTPAPHDAGGSDAGGAPPTPTTPQGRRALLLAMGRDDLPARIQLSSGRLEVAFPSGGFPTLTEEERVMRDVADGLGGTLRTSPLWAFARQPITAHSHGGCSLGVVTDDHGEVKGHPNLFINDGALLPRPVGVNPSGTIAALAERNVAEFVRRRLGVDALPWQADLDASVAWAAAARRAGVALEPPVPVPVTPNHGPIGVSFKEAMAGYLAPCAGPGQLPNPKVARIPLAPFLSAEGTGKAKDGRAGFECRATVLDVGAFLDDPRRTMAIEGTLSLPAGAWSPAPVSVAIDGGALHLLVDETPDRRMMLYRLPFDLNGRHWTLIGHKEIQNDPGFDAWLDTSTLYVEIYEGRVAPSAAHALPALARGILRLGLKDFLDNQLKEMSVEGTDDPARVIWTLGSFTLFFLGELQGIYAPEVQRFVSLFGSADWRPQARPGTTAPRVGSTRFLRGL